MSFQVHTVTGSPVERGDVTVTPQSQVISLRSPFGGFVWHRPVAVLVEQGGQVRRIRVVDVTRLLQVGIAGVALIVAMLLSRSELREGNKHE